MSACIKRKNDVLENVEQEFISDDICKYVPITFVDVKRCFWSYQNKVAKNS